MATALEPVSEALIEAARQRAGKVRASATEDIRTETARAHAQAERILVQAKAEGAAAAAWLSSLQLAAARREAHETVLGARRRAYQMLRHDAIEALRSRGATEEGRRLVDRLSALVGERLGDDAPVHMAGADPLVVEAQFGNRRATIGPASLVDHVLLSMTDEVEGLWA